MIWSNGVAVFWVGAGGSQRSFVDDAFNLYDHRVEDVDVERLATEDHFEMFLEDADDAFPASSSVGCVWGVLDPLDGSQWVDCFGVFLFL